MNTISPEQIDALFTEIKDSMRLRGLQRVVLRSLLGLSARHGIIYASKPKLANMTGAGERWMRNTIRALVAAGRLKEISQKAECLPSILWFPGLVDLTEEQARAIFERVYEGDLKQYSAGGASGRPKADLRQSDRKYSAGQDESPPRRSDIESGGADEDDTHARERSGDLATDLFNELLGILRIPLSPDGNPREQRAKRQQDIQWLRDWLARFEPLFADHLWTNPRKFILSVAREVKAQRPGTEIQRTVRYFGPALQRYFDELSKLRQQAMAAASLAPEKSKTSSSKQQ